MITFKQIWNKVVGLTKTSDIVSQFGFPQVGDIVRHVSLTDWTGKVKYVGTVRNIPTDIVPLLRTTPNYKTLLAKNVLDVEVVVYRDSDADPMHDQMKDVTADNYGLERRERFEQDYRPVKTEKTADIISQIDPMQRIQMGHPIYQRMFNSFFETLRAPEATEVESKTIIRRKTGDPATGITVKFVPEDFSIRIQYHDTDIIRFLPNEVELDNGGWYTKYTAIMMNRFLSYANVPLTIRHKTKRYHRPNASELGYMPTKEEWMQMHQDLEAANSVLYVKSSDNQYYRMDDHIVVASYDGLVTNLSPWEGQPIAGAGSLKFADIVGVPHPIEGQVFVHKDLRSPTQIQRTRQMGLNVNPDTTEYTVHGVGSLGDMLTRFPQLQYSKVLPLTEYGVVYIDEEDYRLLFAPWSSFQSLYMLKKTADILQQIEPEDYDEYLDTIADKYPEYAHPPESEDIEEAEAPPPETIAQEHYPRMTPQQMMEAHAEHVQSFQKYLARKKAEVERDNKIADEYETVCSQYANRHGWESMEDNNDWENPKVVYAKKFADGVHLVQVEGWLDSRTPLYKHDVEEILYDSSSWTEKWNAIFSNKDLLEELMEQHGYTEFDEVDPMEYVSWDLMENGYRPEYYNEKGSDAYKAMLSMMYKQDASVRPFNEHEFYQPAHWPHPKQKPDPNQLSMVNYEGRALPDARTEKELRPHLYTGLTFEFTKTGDIVGQPSLNPLQSEPKMPDTVAIEDNGGLVVYFDGGEGYMGVYNPKDIAKIHQVAVYQKYIGYLKGRHNNNPVVVYFKAQPDAAEIQRRRTNGFTGARWFSLPVEPLVNPIASLKFADSSFRGWVAPNGVKYTTGEGEEHATHASRLLRKLYPNWNWEDDSRFEEAGVLYASSALKFKGWVRVVGAGLYSTWKLTSNAKDTIVELASELPEYTRMHLDVIDGRSFNGTVGQFLESYSALDLTFQKTADIIDVPTMKVKPHIVFAPSGNAFDPAWDIYWSDGRYIISFPTYNRAKEQSQLLAHMNNTTWAEEEIAPVLASLKFADVIGLESPKENVYLISPTDLDTYEWGIYANGEDLPCGLFPSQYEAEKFANKNNWKYTVDGQVAASLKFADIINSFRELGNEGEEPQEGTLYIKKENGHWAGYFAGKVIPAVFSDVLSDVEQWARSGGYTYEVEREPRTPQEEGEPIVAPINAEHFETIRPEHTVQLLEGVHGVEPALQQNIVRNTPMEVWIPLADAYEQMQPNDVWMVRRTDVPDVGKQWTIKSNERTAIGRKMSVKIDAVTYGVNPPKRHEELYKAHKVSGAITASLKFSRMFHGWISPSGEQIDAADHEEAAMEIIEASFRYTQEYNRYARPSHSESAYRFLLDKGWVRVSDNHITVGKTEGDTESALVEYVSQLPKNTAIFVELWNHENSGTFSDYTTLFDGDAKAFLQHFAHKGKLMMKQADWVGYLSTQTFDVGHFWVYARPNQIWMFMRKGEGNHAGSDVKRFVRITSLDEPLKLVHGIYGYDLEKVIDGDISTGKPEDDGWHDIKFVQVFQKPQEENETV